MASFDHFDVAAEVDRHCRQDNNREQSYDSCVLWRQSEDKQFDFTTRHPPLNSCVSSLVVEGGVHDLNISINGYRAEMGLFSDNLVKQNAENADGTMRPESGRFINYNRVEESNNEDELLSFIWLMNDSVKSFHRVAPELEDFY